MTVARKSGVARRLDEESATVSESESVAGKVSVSISTAKSELILCSCDEWKKTRMVRLILEIERELKLIVQ